MPAFPCLQAAIVHGMLVTDAEHRVTMEEVMASKWFAAQLSKELEDAESVLALQEEMQDQ
eukprot:7916090-Pyramimonas_sp.AAC.1